MLPLPITVIHRSEYSRPLSFSRQTLRSTP
jgi:hypothetical protein